MPVMGKGLKQRELWARRLTAFVKNQQQRYLLTASSALRVKSLRVRTARHVDGTSSLLGPCAATSPKNRLSLPTEAVSPSREKTLFASTVLWRFFFFFFAGVAPSRCRRPGLP